MVANDSVKMAVDSLIRDGLSDITEAHTEIAILKHCKDSFQGEIEKAVKAATFEDMKFCPIKHILSPKNRLIFNYRRAAIIEPSCLAKYLATVLQAAETIEKSRIPISENRIYSARFTPSEDSLLSKEVSYRAWLDRTRELADSDDCNYVVQSDISAFYDRINIHRLKSTLEDIHVDREITNKIDKLLLFWAKKDSYGLPVGNIASRILAEVALIDVDRYLLDEDVNFVRYVDDYRIFAKDLVTAQAGMNKLTARLFREGLLLNPSKTSLYAAKKSTEVETECEGEDSADSVLKVIRSLTGGYNRVAKSFVMPSSEKYEPFRKINIRSEISSLTPNEIHEFSGIQKIVIACLIQKDFDSLLKMAEHSILFLYALDYFIDMLLKNAPFIPPQIRDKIVEHFVGLLTRNDFFALEWHTAKIANLLRDKSYFSKRGLLYIVKSTPKECGTYPSAVALEGLINTASRSEFKTLREIFDRFDSWEKRRIILMSRALPQEEREAWHKAIKPTLQNDHLAYSALNKAVCTTA